jgi:diguanylate cyclase (GGDEF)-like protein
MEVKGKILFLAAGWVLVVFFSWAWERYHAQQNEADAMRKIGRAFFQQVLLTREWNARHGGVYVFADAQTPSNPYLKDPLRDITLADGRTLTLVNPAYMTRQLSDIAKEYAGPQVHITSLNPIRPENAPLPWERPVLDAFQSGEKEYGAFSDGVYRYMAPLITQKSCLKCHTAQGYKEGDIRGGISITIPYRRDARLVLGGGHLLVGGSGLLLLLLVGGRLRRAYRRMEEQSTIDPLTGIANRRYFMKCAEEEFHRAAREKQPLSIIMADIDYFKRYNDTYGHVEGDRCLKAMAETMHSALKRPGDCIARYGGEEFIILLPNTTLQRAALFAEHLRESVEALQIANTASEAYHVVTGSFGVATFSAADPTFETLIRKADDALYRAKHEGKNRVRTI